MRLTSLAAGIITLAVAGYPAINTLVARAAGTAASSAPRGAPQNDAQVPDSSQTLKVQTNLVNVFVTARDKKNAVLTDLKQEDFKIYEDGTEQKVAFFSKDMNLPITLAILIDTSGSMQSDPGRGTGRRVAFC